MENSEGHNEKIMNPESVPNAQEVGDFGPSNFEKKYLSHPNPKYQHLTEEAENLFENRKKTVDAEFLATSHSEVWLPYLFKKEDRKNQTMGMRPILEKYSFQEYYAELEDFLKEKLADQILVNLACGEYRPVAYRFQKLGPKVVVNVDMSKAKGLRADHKKNLVVGEDILEFVSRLPDNFCSFTISGFDDHVMPEKEYHEALMTEVCRSLKEDGILFGNKSNVLHLARSVPELKPINISGISEDNLAIFEKTPTLQTL